MRCGDLEAAEGAGPDAVEVITQARDAFGRELVEATSSGLAVEHKACFLEHTEMLGDGGTADGHDSSQLVDGERAAAEAVEDGHAS